jgi:hypothetical protein
MENLMNNQENQPMSRENLDALAVRQHKLIDKLKAEIGNLVALSAERLIIIEELRATPAQPTQTPPQTSTPDLDPNPDPQP